MVEGDPRRRDLAKPYEYPGHVKPEDYPPDYIALLSLMLGLVGLLMKSKVASWLAMYACISSLANVKRSEADVKQIMISITFAGMGLFMNYFRNPQYA